VCRLLNRRSRRWIGRAGISALSLGGGGTVVPGDMKLERICVNGRTANPAPGTY
jgi:hypothetical protein